MQQAVVVIFMLLGAFFMFISGLGIIRLPDLYMRVSAATKASTLGAGFSLLSLAVHFDSFDIAMLSVATIGFLVMTAPIAAHLISQAAYHVGVELWKYTILDELRVKRRETGREEVTDL
mgnify:CR=1 FL=1